MDIIIRKALSSDSESIMKLLLYIADLHHNGRPDIFRPASKKYTMAEFEDILRDEKKPVFVADDGSGNVLGYAFCILKECTGHAMLCDRKTLYIDDFCVDERYRGRQIARRLMEAVKAFAARQGAASIELNVWNFNEPAVAFYEHFGFTPLKTIMELSI